MKECRDEIFGRCLHKKSCRSFRSYFFKLDLNGHFILNAYLRVATVQYTGTVSTGLRSRFLPEGIYSSHAICGELVVRAVLNSNQASLESSIAKQNKIALFNGGFFRTNYYQAEAGFNHASLK